MVSGVKRNRGAGDFCQRMSVAFFEDEIWILDQIRERAKIKGISITQEITQTLGEHYNAIEVGDVSNKTVEVPRHIFKGMEQLLHEIVAFKPLSKRRKKK